MEIKVPVTYNGYRIGTATVTDDGKVTDACMSVEIEQFSNPMARDLMHFMTTGMVNELSVAPVVIPAVPADPPPDMDIIRPPGIPPYTVSWMRNYRPGHFDNPGQIP